MAFTAPDPGEMREVLGIEWCPAYEDKKDAYNAPEPQWQAFTEAVSRRAKVEAISGREYWQAQQANSSVTYTVTIRYLPGLKAGRFRFQWRNLILNIASVINPDNQKVWHVCMCTAKERPAQHRG